MSVIVGILVMDMFGVFGDDDEFEMLFFLLFWYYKDNVKIFIVSVGNLMYYVVILMYEYWIWIVGWGWCVEG